MDFERSNIGLMTATLVSHDGQLDSTFALYVRVSRKLLRWSRHELAQCTSLDYSLLTEIENGIVHATDLQEYHLQAIERAFGISYDQFRWCTVDACKEIDEDSSQEENDSTHRMWTHNAERCTTRALIPV